MTSRGHRVAAHARAAAHPRREAVSTNDDEPTRYSAATNPAIGTRGGANEPVVITHVSSPAIVGSSGTAGRASRMR